VSAMEAYLRIQLLPSSISQSSPPRPGFADRCDRFHTYFRPAGALDDPAVENVDVWFGELTLLLADRLCARQTGDCIHAATRAIK
jgi:hypothetical protein